MADIQNIKCNNQRKTSPKRRNFALYKEIGVGDSKNVIVFDPLVTGHVIRRMRSGRVRIFNGNQWEPL